MRNILSYPRSVGIATKNSPRLGSVAKGVSLVSPRTTRSRLVIFRPHGATLKGHSHGRYACILDCSVIPLLLQQGRRTAELLLSPSVTDLLHDLHPADRQGRALASPSPSLVRLPGKAAPRPQLRTRGPPPPSRSARTADCPLLRGALSSLPSARPWQG